MHIVSPSAAPLAPDQVMVGNALSDTEPRVGTIPGTVKFWRQYLNPATDSAYLVMYAINRNLFLTVTMRYSLSAASQPNFPDDLVERAFTASTVSLLPQ